tara:strand:- start:286 stop:1275 length:990 start_codon:yes stop_codon:yes gene_type:complete
MAKPNSRQTLKDYCLRQLGYPVLEVNVDDDQVEDRLDDALQLYQDYHFDATEKLLLKHKVTASTLTFSSEPSAAFTVGEKITGATSNATAIVVDEPTTTTLRFKKSKDGNGVANTDSNSSFSAGETVTGSGSGTTGTVSTVVFGDTDNKFIPIDDSIIGVERVFPFDHSQSDVNMFDVRYQLHLNDIYDLSTTSLISYDMAQRRISELEYIFNQAPRFSFSRHADRLHLDVDYDDDEISPDKFILFEAYKILSPDDHTQVYNDMFLKKYLTSLIKKQWGMNLIKFEGVQLPGGTTLNGRQIYDDASQELERLDEELQLKYQLPDDFMIG